MNNKTAQLEGCKMLCVLCEERTVSADIWGKTTGCCDLCIKTHKREWDELRNKNTPTI